MEAVNATFFLFPEYTPYLFLSEAYDVQNSSK